MQRSREGWYINGLLIASPASSSGASANIEGALDRVTRVASYLEGTAFGLGLEVVTARPRHSVST